METTALLRLMGFLLMWIAIGNINVLPFGLLPIAVPWSLVEVALAVLIAERIMGKLDSEQQGGGYSPTASPPSKTTL